MTWIFSDVQSSSDQGAEDAKGYSTAAAARHSPFFSIVMYDNATGVQDSTGEQMAVFHHFGGELELEIDMLDMSASQVAQVILEFIGRAKFVRII